MKILIVCLGNICRSPLAEGILKQKVKEHNLNWVIESAGTNGYHTGEAPHKLSQKVALLNGINISQQRSRKFTTEDIKHFDIIYAMANDVLLDIKRISANNFNSKKVILFLNEIYVNQNKDVPDPWYGEEDGYHTVFDLIEETCTKIIEKYKTN